MTAVELGLVFFEVMRVEPASGVDPGESAGERSEPVGGLAGDQSDPERAGLGGLFAKTPAPGGLENEGFAHLAEADDHQPGRGGGGIRKSGALVPVDEARAAISPMLKYSRRMSER